MTREWSFILEVAEGSDEFWETLQDGEVQELQDAIISALESRGFFDVELKPIKFTKLYR